MIRLLQRTETEKSGTRILWQQADIGRTYDHMANYPHTPQSTESCYYCRYCQTFRSLGEFNDCQHKHACKGGLLPFIRMSRPITLEFEGFYDNPDGTELTYDSTGLFKQVTFEAQPHHVELFLCKNGQCECNASCWYHAWRLANKKTWRQCGKTHLCQNDGSAWVQLAPSNDTLYNEYLEQL